MQPVYQAPTATVSVPPTATTVPTPPTVMAAVTSAPPPPPPPPQPVTPTAPAVGISGEHLDISDIIIDSESQSGQAPRGRGSSPSQDSLAGQACISPVPAPTFEDNVIIPGIKNSERIAIAYKYCTIPDKPPVQRPVSQARGEDRNVDDDREDTTKNSFPVADYIPLAFQHFTIKYKKEVDDAFIIDENQGKSTEGPGTLSHSQKSALKGAPEQYRWAFNCHTKEWADFVKFDRDINTIRRNSQSNVNQSLTLPPEEWGHLQVAATHGMQAGSHCDWFNTASRAAIDSVLVTLDPATHADTISCLQEVKQMLKGVAYANEHIVDNFVYVHAGITAALRENFIRSEGTHIPQDMRPYLQFQPFGGNMVFNGRCAIPAARIKAENTDAAMCKIAKGTTPSNPRGGSGPRIPKKDHKKPPPPPPQNQFKSPLQSHPAASTAPHPAGRGQGSFRGGKPNPTRGRTQGGPKSKNNW